MTLENAALLATLLSGILTIILFFKHDAVTKQKHVSISTVIVALISSLFLGWLIVSQSTHLPPFIVFIGAILSVVALLIVGELSLQWTPLQQAHVGSGKEKNDAEAHKPSQQESLDENDHSQESHYPHVKSFLLVVIMSTLVLLSGLFWWTWALEPSSVPSLPKANPAATILQGYCQDLVSNRVDQALTYISNINTLINPLNEGVLVGNIEKDTKYAGKLIACTSTASDHTTNANGTPYTVGSVIYSFSKGGVQLVHGYGLFQDSSSSTWKIDTTYWTNPLVVY